jgi:hypothetical protein
MCPKCIQEEEAAEDTVAEFLRDVKKASVDDIHKATGVKHKVILRMIQRGRIFSGTISYPCETCGAPITEGRVCNDCNKSITGQINKPEAWQAPKKQEPAKKDERMYIKDLLGRK